MEGVINIARKDAHVGHDFHELIADLAEGLGLTAGSGFGCFVDFVVCAVDGFPEGIIVVAQFEELGIGKFKEVRQVRASRPIQHNRRIPRQVDDIVLAVGEAVYEGILPRFFAKRRLVLHDKGRQVPIGELVLEIVDDKILIKVGNAHLRARRPDRIRDGIDVFADHVFWQGVDGNGQVLVFFIGNVFRDFQMKDKTDDANVKDAGLDDRCVLVPGKFHIMGSQFNKARGILKTDGVWCTLFKSQTGCNLVPAGPDGFHDIEVDFIGDVEKVVKDNG